MLREVPNCELIHADHGYNDHSRGWHVYGAEICDYIMVSELSGIGVTPIWRTENFLCIAPCGAVRRGTSPPVDAERVVDGAVSSDRVVATRRYSIERTADSGESVVSRRPGARLEEAHRISLRPYVVINGHARVRARPEQLRFLQFDFHATFAGSGTLDTRDDTPFLRINRVPRTSRRCTQCEISRIPASATSAVGEASPLLNLMLSLSPLFSPPPFLSLSLFSIYE